MRKAIVVMLVVGVLVATSIALYLAGFVRFNYPDLSRFPVRGIDISHHQGPIDWQVLAQRPPGFVFIKASEGAQFKDPRFQANWKAAEQLGIPHGAYHFFNFCVPGLVQARNFTAVVPPAPRVLPPAVDIEFTGNCAAWPGPVPVRAELQAMLFELERVYRRRAILYVTPDAYRQIVAGHFLGHALWARNIFWQPSLSGDRPWAFWQFADRGRMAGIRGPVDLNVFAGQPNELAALVQPGA